MAAFKGPLDKEKAVEVSLETDEEGEISNSCLLHWFWHWSINRLKSIHVVSVVQMRYKCRKKKNSQPRSLGYFFIKSIVCMTDLEASTIGVVE